MITVKANGVPLDLNKDYKIEIKKHSQLFSFDKIMGDMVVDITFPETDNNRSILLDPNNFALVRDSKEFENSTIECNGNILLRGTIVLNEGFSASFRGAIGNLSAKQSDMYISDLDLPVRTFINASSYDDSTIDYCAPTIINNLFFDGVSKSQPSRIDVDGNEIQETLLQKKHANNFYLINSPAFAGNVDNNLDELIFFASDINTYKLTVVSPFMFLFNATKHIFSAYDYFIRENEISTISELRRLCIYNNCDLNIMTSDTSEIIQGKELKDGTLWVFQKFDVYSAAREMGTFTINKLLPDIKLSEYILGIQNLLNVVFAFRDDNYIDIIDREKVFDAEPVDISEYQIGNWVLGEQKNVTLKFEQKHDENDEFFSVYYKDLSKRLDDFADDLNTIDDLEFTTGSFLGELRRVKENNAIYEWNFTVDQNAITGLEKQIYSWKFISNDFQPGFINYSSEQNEEKVETCFSTLAGDTIPIAQQPGKCSLRMSSEAPFSPRLLFYKGGLSCSNETDNYSLRFNGDKGLLQKRWHVFGNWWATRQKVTGKFHLPQSVLQTIDINKPVKSADGTVLIDEMITQYSHAGPLVTQIVGYRV